MELRRRVLSVLSVVAPQERTLARLVAACKRGDVKTVRGLLRTAPLTTPSKTEALLAVLNMDVYMLEYRQVVAQLLEAGAKPDIKRKDGYTLLYMACCKKWSKVIELLLQAGADPNIESRHRGTLAVACQDGYVGIVRMLLKAHADVNAFHDDTTPLALAIKCGDSENVRLLLNAGANAFKEDKDGLLPLHQSYKYGTTEIVDVLLNVGADPKSTSKDGSTALHYERNADAARRLLDLGVDVHATNADGMTPLHSACGDYRHEVVSVLLDAGANIHTKANSGHAPFHCVLARAYYGLGNYWRFSGLTDTLQVLVAHGVSWDAMADGMARGRHMIYLSFWLEEEVIWHPNDDWRSVARAIRACVMQWKSEVERGIEMTHVPDKSILGGLEATETYLNEIKASQEIGLLRIEVY